MELMFGRQQFIDRYMSIVKLSTVYGRKEINLLMILGEWMKRILKLKESGIICIVPLIRQV